MDESLARKRAEARMGKGWTMLSPEIREALILREAALILLDQVDPRYKAAADYLRQVYREDCPER